MYHIKDKKIKSAQKDACSHKKNLAMSMNSNMITHAHPRSRDLKLTEQSDG